METITGRALVDQGKGLLIAWDDVRCGLAYRHFCLIGLKESRQLLRTLSISEDGPDTGITDDIVSLGQELGLRISPRDVEWVSAQVDSSLQGLFPAGCMGTSH
ncbi:hypothetical protein [Marinobacter sp. P4B1]|uniref:hypothetical protein n=1 Tax=Marinobacter sp. P4B1 TaxID=1119533 RepID=UPI00071CE3DF|nr:hypothetical protein [Marinobacter sp. P4B1]KRW83766.1 hypothetical protein AQ621_17095 [Marinobacter sp. P4B1]